MNSILRFLLLITATGFCSVSLSDEAVDFQRDIRPLLADNCFQCHGPDPEHREANFRLDVQESAHDSAIVPGSPSESDFISRIVSTDEDEQMPPPNSGKVLSAKDIDLLKRWVAQGAKYETHWAFVAPVRPPVPKPRNPGWIRNPIDAFVATRLEDAQFSPSPEADRPTWLRRISLDLIGLPPTIKEVDDFLADQTEDAYDKQIGRLLESPHYGERWGRLWLDAARYADSDGYEKDKPRDMWMYRDWVVNALNEDMPYNDFIIHQIAGDLLDSADQSSRIATGFLRNSMVNEEGGADPEQFRNEAMFDRMDAVGKAVLGLTLSCAQCHSHKYDPLTHEAYYQMFAFLNNTTDAIIPVYTSTEQQTREHLIGEINRIESNLKKSTDDWQTQMRQWEKSVVENETNWTPLKIIETPYEGTKYRMLEDLSIISESWAPKDSTSQFIAHTNLKDITGFRLELLTHPQLPRNGPGRSIKGVTAISEFKVHIATKDKPKSKTTLEWATASSDVNPASAPQPKYLIDIKKKGGDKRITGPIEFAIDGNDETGWTTDIDPGQRNRPRNVVFVPKSPVGYDSGTIINFQPIIRHGGWNHDDNHSCVPWAIPLFGHDRSIASRVSDFSVRTKAVEYPGRDTNTATAG